MAISGGDGSIILTTEVDTKGIEKGTANIKNATERTNKSVKNLGLELSRALNAGDTKSAQLINNFKKATEEVERQSAKVDELKYKLQGLESGQIKIEDKGTAKLQSDFEKATASVEKTQNEVNELYMQLDRLQMEAFKAPDTGNIVFTGKEQAEFDKLNARLDELEPKLEENKQKANELGVALRNATGTGTQAEIEKTRTKLAEAESKLQNLSTKAEIAGQKMNGGMNTYHKEVSSTEQALSKLGKRIGRLAISALIFSAITKAFTELRKTIGSMLMSNEQFRNSVYMLQASLWTLAQPIYEAVLPALQSLMSWLTKAILYVATFFSALGGKTLRQTIASAKALNSQASAYKNVASASKEARKQLASFDDLNILQEGKASTGANLSGINSSFDDLESLLNDSDMQNLQDFENWVLTHQDSIKTALEIAGLGLLGLAIGGVISKIGNLLGWFKKKDSGLDTQTKKTKTETEAVRELSYAWSLAPALAYGLVPALDSLTNSGLEFIPIFQGATDKAYGLVPAFQTATDTVTAFDTEIVRAMPNTAKNVAIATGNIVRSLQTLTPELLNTELGVKTFSTNSSKNIFDFAKSTITNIGTAMSFTAKSIYEALSNSDLNVKIFVISVAKKFSGAAETIGKAMQNAVDNVFKAFDWIQEASKKVEKNEKPSSPKKSGINWSTVAGLAGLGLLTAVATFSPIPGDEVAVGSAFAALLPALAKGGIVPHATTALIGEKGKEAVLPLENNTEWMDMLADRILMRSGNINIGGGNTEVVLEIDGREFGRAVVEQGNRENRRIGTRLVIA